MTQDRILMFSMVHKLSCGLAQTSKSDYISRDFLKQSYVKDLNWDFKRPADFQLSFEREIWLFQLLALAVCAGFTELDKDNYDTNS